MRVRLIALMALSVAMGIGASACTSSSAHPTAGSGGSASARPSTPAPTTVLSKVYLAANGWSAASPVFAPKNVAVSADSSFFLDSMTWAWSSSEAIGSGIGTVNTCQPDCATGKHVSAPIKVTLSKPQQVCGHDFFTDMVITWVARNPDPSQPKTSTLASGAPLC